MAPLILSRCKNLLTVMLRSISIWRSEKQNKFLPSIILNSSDFAKPVAHSVAYWPCAALEVDPFAAGQHHLSLILLAAFE